MSKPDWSPERRELERVANEYRSRGFDVLVEPAVAELPEFVREYRPDILARSQNECLVIEVKLPKTDADRERIRVLAHRVESRPGWRFILVAPDTQEAVAPGDLLRVRRPHDIEKLVAEAEALSRAGHQQGALLMAWAAVEGAMRFAAEQRSLDVRRPDSWTVMRELVSRGILDRGRYEQLVELYRLRSALAHGFEQAVPTPNSKLDRAIETLAASARELLAESASRAD